MNVELLNPEDAKELFADWGKVSAVCYDTQTQHPEKIGQHCLQSNHMSGSRGTYIKFKITEVPRFTLDQLFRHEIGVFKNMGSFRYIDKNYFFYEVPSEIIDDQEMLDKYEKHMNDTYELYESIQNYVLCKTGEKERANEQARYVLPMSTHTSCVIGFDIEALIHLCNKRLCTRTEDVFRELTILIKDSVLEILPDLKSYLVPQCQALFYCPEKNSCGRALTLNELKTAIAQYKESKNK